jgi:23S rRNA C2498 (ribose-2'-O)-methylase RlmM
MDKNVTGSLVFLCRPEFRDALTEEICIRTGAAAADIAAAAPDMLILNGAPAAHQALQRPLIFERQRIENAMRIPVMSLKQTARDIVRQLLPAITFSEKPWTVHAFAADSVEGRTCSARARNLEQVLLDDCKDRFGRVFRRYKPASPADRDGQMLVLSLCVVPEGVWGGVVAQERLSDPRPGGDHRMAFDRNAPCRSYLKIEEALDLMNERPRPGETVVDLGASPGGWSYAFLKRGCRVTAVDNGPMRITHPEQFGGSLTHVMEDGVLFKPASSDIPLDWLVSDMLVSTGKNLGMLKNWFTNKWMLRFVVNVKLPQIHPYPALQPLEAFLGTVPGIRFSFRQLYHDRREVTLFGSCGQT